MPRKKKLPHPSEELTPLARGELLLRYIAAEASLLSGEGEPLNFARSMLVGADLHELDLSGTLLDESRLDEADLSGTVAMQAQLSGASFRGANLQCAMLREALLGNADFTEANLEEADLGEAILHGAVFRCANLYGAQLDGANLEGACFDGAKNLHTAEVTGARISKVTYDRSAWTPETLRRLVERGIEVVGLNEFPADAVRAVILRGDGLTLTFAAKLSRVDRFMVDGLIVGVLGPDAEDCEVADLSRAEGTTIIRLTASDPALLLKLAAEIEHRAVEARPQGVQSVTNLASVASQINVSGNLILARDPEIRVRLAALERVFGQVGRLTEILSRLEGLDLRLPGSLNPDESL